MINGNILDELRSLYTGELLSVEVPEWPFLDDGLIYYTPLTVKEYARLKPYVDKDDPQLAIEVLILKAKNRAGEHLFEAGKGTREILRGDVDDCPIPNHVLDRIASQMLFVPEPDTLKKS